VEDAKGGMRRVEEDGAAAIVRVGEMAAVGIFYERCGTAGRNVLCPSGHVNLLRR